MKIIDGLLVIIVLVQGCSSQPGTIPTATTLPYPVVLSPVPSEIFSTLEPDLDLPVTPIDGSPKPIQTASDATKAAYPVQGSVVWEDGKCCIGGIAGDTLQARVTFTATSPFGVVREMRMAFGWMCYEEGQLSEKAWEPYVPSSAYPISVALNWVGYYISVQYRNEQGNLSPVYCDDISVEGLPPITPSSQP